MFHAVNLVKKKRKKKKKRHTDMDKQEEDLIVFCFNLFFLYQRIALSPSTHNALWFIPPPPIALLSRTIWSLFVGAVSVQPLYIIFWNTMFPVEAEACFLIFSKVITLKMSKDSKLQVYNLALVALNRSAVCLF